MRKKKWLVAFQLNIGSIVGLFVILLLCSFTVFVLYSWGRYVMLACIAGIFGMTAVQQQWRYKLRGGYYIPMVAALAAYAFIGALWAIDPADAMASGKTLFEMTAMLLILYSWYHERAAAVGELLNVIKWSSFVIVSYAILFYGMDTLLMMAAAERRLQNGFANVNTIGMLAAVGILIQLDESLRERRMTLPLLFCVPSLFLLAMTQSRKALLMLLGGLVMIWLMRRRKGTTVRESLARLLLTAVAIAAVLYMLLSLPIFAGVAERMNDMFMGFIDSKAADRSTRLRLEMIAIGWEQFLKTPLQGIGMGCPHHLVIAHMGSDCYLHNNFVELLAGGGLIGFSLYYAMYIYLFVRFWKYRQCQNRYYIICLVLMLLLLVMDYGTVSYYSKMRYVYLLLFFLEAEQLKKDARRCRGSENDASNDQAKVESGGAVPCGWTLPRVEECDPQRSR